jgi:hypothetical protein
MPNDSTCNQLLRITNDILEAFEKGRETYAIFMDISKAFDKVWHRGLQVNPFGSDRHYVGDLGHLYFPLHLVELNTTRCLYCSGNQKPSSGENLMEFDRDFDFFSAV